MTAVHVAADVSSRMVPDAGPEAGPDSGGWGSDDDGDAGGFDHWEAPDGGDAHPGSAEAREGPTFGAKIWVLTSMIW